jgi:hypothetical protein
MKKRYYLLSLGVLAAFTFGCERRTPLRDDVWVPIYRDKSETAKVGNIDPIPVVQAGKIYAYKNFLFQMELNKGIHVYKVDNQIPRPLTFIEVPGAQEISIKDEYLYTNNYEDLVVINIDNPTNASLVATLEDAFKLISINRPPSSGYFQCIDERKGTVIGWEKQNGVPADCMY